MKKIDYDSISPITGNKCVIEEANEHDNTVSYLCMESGFSSHEKLIEGSDDFVHTLDNVYLAVGTGQDLTFHHDGTDSFIGNATGDLTIRNFANDKDIVLKNYDYTKNFNRIANENYKFVYL